MAKYIPGVGWEGEEPASRFSEIAESGESPGFAFSRRERNQNSKAYYSQLADKPNDPKAFMSHDDARRECDKRGYQYTDMKNFSS